MLLGRIGIVSIVVYTIYDAFIIQGACDLPSVCINSSLHGRWQLHSCLMLHGCIYVIRPAGSSLSHLCLSWRCKVDFSVNFIIGSLWADEKG